MADSTNKIPPPPTAVEITPEKSNVDKHGGRGNDRNLGSNKINVAWVRWFQQLVEKVNLLTAQAASIVGVTGTGFIATDSTTAVTRTITGTAANISVSNGTGISGNPVINLIDTAVTPGTYGTATQVFTGTVDQKGRLTAASNTNIDIAVVSNVVATYGETAVLGIKTVFADATTGAIVITLPTAVGNKAIFRFKKTDAGANAVTIAATGGQTFDGAANVPLAAQYANATIVSDGTNWGVF